MSTTIGASAVAPSYMLQQHTSAWHSPVPYLFGGLAAMLGLIAFALFILACSYWKLSGRFENQRVQDLEAGKDDVKVAKPVILEEKFLVIMAGHDKPTYIATPVTSRASSFGSNNTSSSSSTSCSGSGTLVVTEKKSDVEAHEDSQDQIH